MRNPMFRPAKRRIDWNHDQLLPHPPDHSSYSRQRHRRRIHARLGRAGPDPALVRGDRSGHPRLHQQHGQEGAGRRQDLLHTRRWHPASTGSHSRFPQTDRRREHFSGSHHRAGRSHDGRHLRAAGRGGDRRQCRLRVAGMAKHLSGRRDLWRADPFREARRKLAQRDAALAARSRQAVFPLRRAHQGDLHRIAGQSYTMCSSSTASPSPGR